MLHVVSKHSPGHQTTFSKVTTEHGQHLLQDIASKRPFRERFRKVASYNNKVSSEILSVAQSRSADLIVMGTRSNKLLPRVLLGSTSHDVLLKSKVPVAVIPDTYTGRSDNAIVAFDGSPAAIAAIQWAHKNIPKEVTVISCWDTKGRHKEDVENQIDQNRVMTQAKSDLDLAVNTIYGNNTDQNILVTKLLNGDPKELLIEESKKSSMIIMGSKGHKGILELFIGSVTTYITTHSTVPVVVIPPVPISQ